MWTSLLLQNEHKEVKVDDILGREEAEKAIKEAMVGSWRLALFPAAHASCSQCAKHQASNPPSHSSLRSHTSALMPQQLTRWPLILCILGARCTGQLVLLHACVLVAKLL